MARDTTAAIRSNKDRRHGIMLAKSDGAESSYALLSRRLGDSRKGISCERRQSKAANGIINV